MLNVCIKKIELKKFIKNYIKWLILITITCINQLIE